MSRTRTPRVLVLYVHPLLGQGLARLLAAQAGVRAVAVSALDDVARATALSKRPDLIIAEESGDAPNVESTQSLPVVFVRVDAECGGRLGQPLTDPDLIIALARGLAAVPFDNLTQSARIPASQRVPVASAMTAGQPVPDFYPPADGIDQPRSPRCKSGIDLRPLLIPSTGAEIEPRPTSAQRSRRQPR